LIRSLRFALHPDFLHLLAITPPLSSKRAQTRCLSHTCTHAHAHAHTHTRTHAHTHTSAYAHCRHIDTAADSADTTTHVCVFLGASKEKTSVRRHTASHTEFSVFVLTTRRSNVATISASPPFSRCAHREMRRFARQHATRQKLLARQRTAARTYTQQQHNTILSALHNSATHDKTFQHTRTTHEETVCATRHRRLSLWGGYD